MLIGEIRGWSEGRNIIPDGRRVFILSLTYSFFIFSTPILIASLRSGISCNMHGTDKVLHKVAICLWTVTTMRLQNGA